MAAIGGNLGFDTLKKRTFLNASGRGMARGCYRFDKATAWAYSNGQGGNCMGYWITTLCEWIQSVLQRRQGPDLGESSMDRTSRKIAWVFFFVLWLPLITFLLVVVWKPDWLFK